MSQETTPACHEVQVALSCEQTLSASQNAHLARCDACAAHAGSVSTLLPAARLPADPAFDRAALAGLEAAVSRGLSARRTEPTLMRRFSGYVLAAGLGSILTYASVPKQPLPMTHAAVEAPAVIADSSPLSEDGLGDFDFDEANLLDDAVSIEVGWPAFD